MENLINTKQQEGVITLKEITDLISVEHNKAMKQVEKLSSEPSFGGVERIATPTYNPDGSVNRNILTFNLTKKQAIAVGAKLNNSLLMKVIDRLEELEQQNNKPLTITDQIQLMAQGYIQIESRLDKIENNSRLTNQQECALIQAKNVKVYDLVERHGLIVSTVHRRIWQLFKKKFSLPRYNELSNGQFQEGLQFINSITVADLV